MTGDSNRTVLVVEDDRNALDAMRAFLEQACYRVVALNSGHEIASNPIRPDLLITDWQLGDGPDGIDIAREFRKRAPTLPIIFVTAFPIALLRRKCSDLPGVKVIAKPIHLATLATIVEQSLEH